jgi:predicted RNA-binding Zn ribbon-like protein
MKQDKNLPESYGSKRLPPVSLSREEEDLCWKLDKFYKFYNLNKKPSEFYKGAIFAARDENRSNPDWLAQAAHSLREILYPFFSPQIKKVKDKKKKAFEKFGSVGSKLIKDEEIGKLYNKLQDVAHHRFIKDFENLRQEFIKIIKKALAYQTDIHKLIDEILEKELIKSQQKQLKNEIEDLIYINSDAHFYFFYKADERWIDWFWENGFLDAIKQKAEDPTRYSYKTPELNYLVKVAEKIPEKVVDIMLKVPISKETFNPEVIDRFVYICSKLPVEQLVRMIPKIKSEKWIPLMNIFNQRMYGYEEILKKLFEAKDFDNLLTLAETILSVKSKEEIKSQSKFSENPFYFENLSYTKVFWYLVNVSDEYLEKSLDLSIKILKEVIDNISDKSEESIFKLKDNFYLFEDFSDLKVGEDKDLWGKDNIKELIAAILEISRRLIKEKYKDNKEELRKIFKDILDFENSEILPDAYSLWRLRLAILQLDCSTFKEEIKKTLFRVFNVGDRYYIVLTTEYQKLLRDCFGILEEEDKRDYVKQVIEFFAGQKEKNPDKKWIIKDGSKILSLIFNHLTEEEKTKSKKNGFELNPDIEIKPEVEIKFGSISHRAPISYEEFSKMEIKKILEKLINEWAPEEIYKKYKYYENINAGGIGDLLKKDIPKRLEKYLENAVEFFDREKIHSHYTYSFLMGTQQAIKNNRIKAKDIDWENLINLLLKIKESGEKNGFQEKFQEKDFDDIWLANWNSVHFVMTDVIRELLKNEDGIVVIDFSKYRGELLKIIKYLLNYPDPTPEDEDITTAKMIGEREKVKKVSDPFTMAINSVRGRAFEDFVLFIYQDGDKLNEDVKEIFEEVLDKENTRALMFMFGYYLPSFYFRDKEWVRSLFSKIFPKENNRLYTASWQGYLSQNLYEELFFESKIQKLYEYGINLEEKDYNQENFRDLNEGIAVHLALAFIHFKDFGFENKLFQKFWEEGTPNQHFHFVNFIGRYLITGGDKRINDIKNQGLDIEKRIKDFWDWMLEKYTKDKKPFEAFGFWIDLDKEIFEGKKLANLIRRTLEKTNGVLDWDYALMKNIVKLAQESPEDTLEILRLFLLKGIVENRRENRILIHINQEWYEAFNILYQYPKTQDEIISLINKLLGEGGKRFWVLEEIIKQNVKKHNQK